MFSVRYKENLPAVIDVWCVFSGWISAIAVIGSNKAVGAIMMVVAAFFTAAAALSVVLLKMVSIP